MILVAHGKEKHTVLFAQLGSVFSTENKEGLSHTSLTERHWDETGFVLALEILESGSAGKLICNLTRQNEWEELTDEDIYGDPWLCRLCGEEPPFLLLRRLRTKLDHVKDTWAKTCKEQEEI
ncbi:hypothetical protein MMC31_000808 [Peltigera leucophlebia]|nr:hypothetical protein [Peltigera leucophlebia]